MKWMLAPLLTAGLSAAPALADRKAQREADIQAGQAKLAELTKGLTPGKPMACAPTNQPTESQSIDGVGILYRLGARRYLSSFSPSCPEFRSDAIPVIVSHGMSCRGDIVRLVDRASGFPMGSCVLGDFIPYEKPKG